MHWARWRKLCKPKSYSGIGFQSLYDFNRALLAKQVWISIHDPSSLMSHALKARYFKRVDIMDVKLGSKPSYIWWSILWSWDLIQKWIRWRVGNGHQIKFLSDRWIPRLTSGMSFLCGLNWTIMVTDLISSCRAWKEDEEHELFHSFEVDYILDITLSKQN